ncbi:MAG: alpha/beta hydrolase [Alphaproteobacteria bacterium]|nr:alpha/beta hydrolase [Alphaproteobacteria bacterium]MBV9692452.1 alpha/beta hydrolase [Alphaproteobacteria bacterium]
MSRIRANGVELEYQELGPRDAIPFLFINGFGSQLTSWPVEFRERLAAAGLRTIAFDNRDIGLSQKWTGQIPDIKAVSEAMRAGRKPDVPYRLDDMAADAAGLLDALGIESAHIAGASMGGMIAQLVALDHPQKARSLISIFSTTGDRSLPPSSPEAQAALTTRPPSNSREDVVAHALKGRRSYASTRWPFDEGRLGALIGHNYDRSYYPEGPGRHWAAILAAPPRTERLKSLKLPTLVLHGSADTLIRPEAGRHTAQCIPGAEYHEIEGWGHDMPLPAIPPVTKLIVNFVKRVEAKAKAAA